jgi:D-alanyl-D-alanine carboxypeptidase
MLLSHTSGIGDYFVHPDYEELVFGRLTHHWTVDEILALAADRRPIFPPGTDYGYSNTNYILLGRILELVGGESLGAQIRARFLEPLGLEHTRFQGEDPIPDGAARGYLREARQWLDQSDGTAFRPNTSAATVAWAAGAMLSTASDLLRWEDALYGGEILAPDSLAEMLAFGRSGYGLGTRRQVLAGLAGIGHGGSLRGFVAGMYRLPELDIDVVVMTNRGRVDPFVTDLADRLVRIALGEDLGGSPSPAASPAP